MTCSTFSISLLLQQEEAALTPLKARLNRIKKAKADEFTWATLAIEN